MMWDKYPNVLSMLEARLRDKEAYLAVCEMK